MKIENEVKKSKIALEMAVYFEENISTKSLAIWVAEVNKDLCLSKEFDKHNKEEAEIYDDAVYFINSLGSFTLPKLIECNSKQERVQLLELGIIDLFSMCGYDESKKSLLVIGKCFLEALARYDYDEETPIFFSTLTVMLYLLDKYSEYEFLDYCIRKEMDESKKVA